MEELIGRIVANVGIDEELARKAVGIILNFLSTAGSEGTVKQMVSAIPGAQALIQEFGSQGDKPGGILGAIGSLTGGSFGAMHTLNQLTDAGLEMGQVRGVAEQVMGYAREQAGDETVDEAIKSIPGLAQFLS